MKLLLSLFLLTALGVVSVRAQENLIGPVVTLPADYRQLLEVYRTKKERFTVSLQQYYTLKTLASQEEVVQVARDLFLTRADVVLVYNGILRGQLLTQDTLEPLKRDTVISRLDEIDTEIKEHRRRVDIAVDRLKVDEEGVWFGSKEKSFIQATDEAGSLIKIGELQKSVRALEQMRDTIVSFYQQAMISETRKVEKQRGIDELNRTIMAVKDSIDSAIANYDKQQEQNSSGFRGGEISSILSDGYIRLLQGIEFAKELVK